MIEELKRCSLIDLGIYTGLIAIGVIFIAEYIAIALTII